MLIVKICYYRCFILGKDSSHVSNPPHLTSKSWSSAFIPFCAYKTDLNISKNPLVLPGITFPLCSAFLPTILEGQLCYELNLNTRSGQGRRNQLTVVLDYNEDRSLQISAEEEKATNFHFSKGTLDFEDAVQSVQGISAKVHIGTLSPYTHFGGGIYTMTSVKNVRATDSFLEMPLTQRNCKIDSYEGCRTRKLLAECECVPWELQSYQVKLQNDLINNWH